LLLLALLDGALEPGFVGLRIGSGLGPLAMRLHHDLCYVAVIYQIISWLV
jgi:hypothetical protein